MDDTVDMLEELPANLVNRILNTVSATDRKMINQLLNYPDDSAGSIMTTEYVDLRDTMTVGQAMAHIKRTGIHKETIYTCYVTERRKLVGIVSAKDLMTTEDDVPIKDLMETEIISVTTHNDQEYVAQLFTKYDLLALPVLDADGLWSESLLSMMQWMSWSMRQPRISQKWLLSIQVKKLILILLSSSMP